MTGATDLFHNQIKSANQTIVTINSLIPNAKALFAKKNLAFLGAKLDLPEILPL
ncbi:MAG: hypothetical protein R3F19_25145 [Verrucomicrobiales bacterium]